MDQVNGTGYFRELEQEQGEKAQPKRTRRSWARIAAKLLIVFTLLLLSLIVGLVIGYSVMGKSPASEVFDLNTFKHMYDLIFAGT